MALTPGTRLGPYEIRSLLGSGGMGDVYRATDTRLDRTIAIKVLPPHAAEHVDRRQRFEREARAVASLSHPHICSLHDIGHDRGIDFLVLEYLHAQTLADLLTKGPLPLDQVLRHAIEIADALDHAHRHGVIHRDLKPGNVMLAKSGVKVLDFGLAKLRAVGSLPDVATVATGQTPLTAPDAILGTFQYMAPEQLEGREADAKTDIFALGSLVYEMATGRRAFDASTSAATIGAILHTEPPPMATVQPAIPQALDRLIARCLAKDPDNRWQTARDVMLELKWIAEGRAEARMPAAKPEFDRRQALAWSAAALLSISTIWLAFMHVRESAVDQRVVRFAILTQPRTDFFSLSPDGRRLAVVAGEPGHARLWIQSLDSLDAQALAGTEGAEFPFWSPDGRFIAFGGGGKLKIVAVSGGAVHTLCDARAVIGGTWNRDDVIVFTPDNRTPLYRVAATGGEPTPVTTLDRLQGQQTHRWPHFLPDGRHFVFLARSSHPEDSGIYLGSLDSSRVTRLIDGNSAVAYAPPGYLFFASDGALLAQPFDASSLRNTGAPIQILGDVAYSKADSLAHFSLSDHGELAYRTSAAAPKSELAWFDREGRRLALPVPPGNVIEPSISPDGTRVAVMQWANASSDIWQLDIARGSTSRLTSDSSIDFAPVWSPKGDSVAFGSNRDGPSDLFQASFGALGTDRQLVKSSTVKHATDWSLDGRLIVYEGRDRKTDWDLWTLLVSGPHTEEPFLQTAFAERLGRLSPDGRWMAYVSNESGRDEVYVRPFPRSSGQWLISTSGGTEPRWRRDGRELFYLSPDNWLMAVPVRSSSGFDRGAPRPLFETRMIDDRVWGYDVTPDGQRFVVGVAVGPPSPAPINIVLNWAADLRR